MDDQKLQPHHRNSDVDNTRPSSPHCDRQSPHASQSWEENNAVEYDAGTHLLTKVPRNIIKGKLPSTLVEHFTHVGRKHPYKDHDPSSQILADRSSDNKGSCRN